MTEPKNPSKSGYKNPPKSTQFKKGVSGNPNGRPKGAKNNKKVFEALADTVIAGTLPDGSEQASIREAVIAQLGAKAVSGNIPAMKKFIDMMEKYDDQNDAYCRAAEIKAIDRIIDCYRQAVHNAGDHFSDEQLNLISIFIKAVELEFNKFIPELDAMFDSNNNAKRTLLEEMS